MANPRSPKTRRPSSLLDIDGLLSYSARILSVWSLTVSELRQKLTKRAAQPASVDEVIRRLQENNYLNDQAFAESFANWRRENEGHGKARVVRDLMARRVSSEVAAKAAQAAYAGADEETMIEQYLQRKYRGHNLAELLCDEKRLASAFRRLRTAGFSAGGSIKVLKRYAAQAEQLEDMDDPERSA